MSDLPQLARIKMISVRMGQLMLSPSIDGYDKRSLKSLVELMIQVGQGPLIVDKKTFPDEPYFQVQIFSLRGANHSTFLIWAFLSDRVLARNATIMFAPIWTMFSHTIYIPGEGPNVIRESISKITTDFCSEYLKANRAYVEPIRSTTEESPLPKNRPNTTGDGTNTRHTK